MLEEANTTLRVDDELVRQGIVNQYEALAEHHILLPNTIDSMNTYTVKGMLQKQMMNDKQLDPETGEAADYTLDETDPNSQVATVTTGGEVLMHMKNNIMANMLE